MGETMTMWIIFGAIALPLLVLASFLLRGKGANLIAGYNTKSPAQKARYNEPALCRFVGILVVVSVLLFVPIVLGIQVEQMWLFWAGVVLSCIVPITGAIYMNKSKHFRK